MLNLIREWGGDIRKLIFYLVIRETPDAENILLKNPQTHSDILEVIEEVSREFDIGGRS